jgi:hypothetical protein
MSINDQLDEEAHKLIYAALEKIFQNVTLYRTRRILSIKLLKWRYVL